MYYVIPASVGITVGARLVDTRNPIHGYGHGHGNAVPPTAARRRLEVAITQLQGESVFPCHCEE